MNETQLDCPACDQVLYRRSMNTSVNLGRRQVTRKNDPYICLQCGQTFEEHEFNEPEMRGQPVEDGW